MAAETSLFTLSSNRTSTCRASASPPAVVISRATVVMVLSGELGSGGKGTFLDASLVDLAATTTGWQAWCQYRGPFFFVSSLVLVFLGCNYLRSRSWPDQLPPGGPCRVMRRLLKRRACPFFEREQDELVFWDKTFLVL